MAADIYVYMAIEMVVYIDVDVADDVDADTSCFHGPVSSCPNIFDLLII
jgi:hypothetical protein